MKFLWKKNNGKAPSDALDNSPPVISYACKVYAISETGPTRSSNEDSILYAYPKGHFRTFFGMVADGMGGHQAGEVASNLACETAREYIHAHSEEANIPAILEGCIRAAQVAIVQAAEQNSLHKGMGTTATMVFIRDGFMYFGHIGDSRLYHFKNNKLVQCTSDNTLVNEMVKEGKITEAEAVHHEMKHVLTQALGTVKEINPELAFTGLGIETGDIFFLCSDGIYDVLQPVEIESLLTMGSSPFAIECIKALCMQRKASDNFSAMLVEITTEQQSMVPITKELNVMT
ncbi:MAG: serine/threonine-protein phosphatase [Chitinophagaceae bacterium]|nr:serine/threonine-protein phosphatase [Chitinophagaceae bacterium]